MLPEVVLQRKLQGIHLVSTVSNGSTGYTSPVGKFFEQILSFRGILTNAPFLLVDGDNWLMVTNKWSVAYSVTHYPPLQGLYFELTWGLRWPPDLFLARLE